MKVYNPSSLSFNSELKNSLDLIRKSRNFNPEKYLEAKSHVLLQYMKRSRLDSCVVAVSGGVDSALVLSIVNYAASLDKANPIIKRIIALTLPVLDNNSASHQSETIIKAQLLCSNLSLPLHTIDTTKSYEQIYPQMENSLLELTSQSKALNKPGSNPHNISDVNSINWARGQLCAYARTPIIYYATSLMSSIGHSAAVIGTTNRDEGAYLGYVGKASDAMVDIQLISDLHKSEVFALARFLNVPSIILNAVPSGDMYDARSDEEVFGASYDAVEFYLNYLNLSPALQQSITQSWSLESHSIFNQNVKALEHLHSYNAHKYNVGSPAIHLDIMESAVAGGWIEGVHSGMFKEKQFKKVLLSSRFTGFVETPPLISQPQLNLESLAIKSTNDIHSIDNLLTQDNLNSILSWAKENAPSMVSTDSHGQKLLPSISPDLPGSSRLSFYSPEFAQILNEKLKFSGFEHFKYLDNLTATNGSASSVWKFIGINPMIRLIKYNVSQGLVAHYDDSYVENKNQKSLMTLLLVISNDCTGGSTRFIKDPQESLDFATRNFSDWDRPAQPQEVILSLKPKPGSAIFFNHRVLHDGEPITSGEKIILRTELMFEKCEL